MKTKICFILFFVFISVNSLSASEKLLDSFVLSHKISNFLKKEKFFNHDNINVIIRTPLNKKIKFCQRPIFSILNNMHTIGLFDLLLTCNQSKYYLTVEVQSKGEYIVAHKYIPHGMIIKESDLKTLIGRLDNLPNHAYQKKQDIVGRVSVRDIFPLQIITSFMTRPIWLVHINQEVEIIIQGNNFTISTKAKALNNGAENDKIRVKTNFGKIINGIVNKDGKVIISL
ncbi:flagellar basal body P-ring formation chaperone FlgA [Buchnera aphidicola]|uniref:flagellar basal body P-ring formation chaperone FlgA n=1 Tax=Buchnera aphidicola TaxID=9 RepID=UPI003CE58B02